MKNRYQVFLFRQSPFDGSYSYQICGAFKNIKSARKRAEKINDRHCQTTRGGRPCRNFVDINKVGVGCVEEMSPVLVPSVGELGYW